MVTVTESLLPQSRPLTREDLAAMPDDGHRYELVDGVLVVSPAPSVAHQRATGRLYRLLDDVCPADLEVFFAPFDVALSDTTVMQPDLLVARRSDLTDRDLPTAPVLAVEVLSPSTRRFDLMLKRDRFAAAGCPSYWAVDPDEPTLWAWELRDGAYAEVDHVTGTGTFHANRPYAVDLSPASLVD